MAQTRFWYKEDAKKELQKHYGDLAALFNAGDYGNIASLYHESSTIVALKSGKVYAGTQGAVDFWTDLATEKKVKTISFRIKEVKLIPSKHFVPRSFPSPDGGLILYQATMQKLGYIGVITTTKSPAVDDDFSGGAFHRDDCSLGCPDNEGFNF